MKYVVIGVATGATLEQIMAVFPRHKAVVNDLIARGVVLGIGPFTDLGNLAIFRDRASAEDFVRRDPFYLEGLVGSYEIHEWSDSLDP